MSETVIALFSNMDQARGAVDEFVAAGFRREQISVIDGSERMVGAADPALEVDLRQLGLPDDEARAFAEGVRRGGIIVSVPAAGGTFEQIRAIMRRHNAFGMSRGHAAQAPDPDARPDYTRAEPTRETAAAAEGWKESSKVGTAAGALSGAATGAALGAVGGPAGAILGAAAGAIAGAGAGAAGDVIGERAMPNKDYRSVNDYSGESATIDAPGTHDFERGVPDFLKHHQAHYFTGGQAFEDYRPAYQLGDELGRAGRSYRVWDEAAPEARTRWERDNALPWERVEEAVRYAWERARGIKRP